MPGSGTTPLMPGSGMWPPMPGSGMGPPATMTMEVKVQGGKYTMNGAPNTVPVMVQAGSELVFKLQDASNNYHPFYLSTTPDGVHGGGTEYMQGVMKSPAASYDSNFGATQVGRELKLMTDSSTPERLYYYCKSHPGMGGEINVMPAEGS